MKKLLLLVGTVLLMWIPGFEMVAQEEVSREAAIEMIQTPLEGEALSNEAADALLAEWEAKVLEVGSIASDDRWILPEYLPEGLNLDHSTHMALITYLESYLLEQTVEEESVVEEEAASEESVESIEEAAEYIDPLEDYYEYRTVINNYYTAIEYYQAGGIPEGVNVTAVEQARNIEIDRMLQFALVDLDGNGVEELLLMSGDQIFEVYTTDINAQERVAIPLFKDDHLVERSYLTLYEGGSMMVLASGGAEYGLYTLYQMTADGLAIEEVDAMMYDSVGMSAEEPYYREEDETTTYTQAEFDTIFEMDQRVTLDVEALDWYPVMDTETLQAILDREAQELDLTTYPYAVDFTSLGDTMTFTMDAVNAPTQIELDLVNHQLTTSSNGNNVNVYQVSFAYVDETVIRVFSQNNPSEIRTVSANTAITLNDIVEGSQAEVIGQTFYLFYNANGGISLATANFAGNVEPDQVDVMLEYVY